MVRQSSNSAQNSQNCASRTGEQQAKLQQTRINTGLLHYRSVQVPESKNFLRPTPVRQSMMVSPHGIPSRRSFSSLPTSSDEPQHALRRSPALGSRVGSRSPAADPSSCPPSAPDSP